MTFKVLIIHSSHDPSKHAYVKPTSHGVARSKFQNLACFARHSDAQSPMQPSQSVGQTQLDKDERERARTARPHCTQHVVCASCALSHGVGSGRCSVNEACTPSDGSGQKTSGPSTTTSSVAATGWRQNTADDHHQSLCLCARAHAP